MIIPGFDIFKYTQANLPSCFEFDSIDPFRFERFEKAFSHSIIPALRFALILCSGFKDLNRFGATLLLPGTFNTLRITSIVHSFELSSLINRKINDLSWR
jgi:hypothetical protein